MLEPWSQFPVHFIVLAIVFLIVLIVVLIAFYKNRGFRHIERMKAMELNRVEESFFAGRLLNYVPWQFWTSFAILLVLIISSFLTDGENRTVFLELTKYVTGAVIGSLFGSNVRNERDNTQGKEEA